MVIVKVILKKVLIIKILNWIFSDCWMILWSIKSLNIKFLLILDKYTILWNYIFWIISILSQIYWRVIIVSLLWSIIKYIFKYSRSISGLKRIFFCIVVKIFRMSRLKEISLVSLRLMCRKDLTLEYRISLISFNLVCINNLKIWLNSWKYNILRIICLGIYHFIIYLELLHLLILIIVNLLISIFEIYFSIIWCLKAWCF